MTTRHPRHQHNRRAATAAAGVVLLLATTACTHHPAAAPPASTPPPTTGSPTTPSPAPFGLPKPASPVPTGKPGLPEGGLVDPATVNQRDADAVGQAALTDMYRQDTTIDTSPTDALRRSVPWLSTHYRTALAAAQPHGAGSTWTSWTAHHAYTRVTVTLEHDYGQPADTPTLALRIYAVTVTPTGRDTWHGTPTSTAVFLTLTRPDARQPWRVDALTTG
jgi:hypothetical protein